MLINLLKNLKRHNYILTAGNLLFSLQLSEQRRQDVQTELLREHVSALPADGVPGGPGRAPQGLYVLSFGLLQVRDMRHEAHAEDVL